MTVLQSSPDSDGDLNVLVPAFMAATPEQRQIALAVLRGERPEGDEPSGDGVERMLTQQEVARALHVHETTVRRWHIPCRHLGRLPRYSMPEVQEYLGSSEFRLRLTELKKARTGAQS